MRRFVRVLVAVLSLSLLVSAQSESATLSGRITDATGSVIVGAQITATNGDTNVTVSTTTNDTGIFIFPSLEPGGYQLTVVAPGFGKLVKNGIVLHVQDRIAQNLALQVGSVDQVITVTAEGTNINATDASVSTIVDRNFGENLPLNGRSFQSLIGLAPGVVFVSSAGGTDSGQFSVNGQRAISNYWTVDGVSANVGSSTLFGGDQTAGAVGTTSVLGGTNSLVSVDAMQEFRIQTSTFAPEYGRTPGAQISIVTRSGSNAFHGSAFEYLRNDIFDSNNWFNGYTNRPTLPKAKERQNDFGGTFSGPILKNRTFFFFSYEGLRLRLPNTGISTVPDAQARQNALPALQPFLNAYPLDPAQPDLGKGIAQFNASYSDPATLDDYSIRIDHNLTDKIKLFGRYNNSPSQLSTRGTSINALSLVRLSRNAGQQATVGLTWGISAHIFNELRINYSRTNASSGTSTDSFGGAVPLSSLPLPSPFTAANGALSYRILSLSNGAFSVGPSVRNVQRQVNLVDTVSVQSGTHDLKFGVDYRRLTPVFRPFQYTQVANFLNVSSAENGSVFSSLTISDLPATFLFQNLSIFAQDAWHVGPRLTFTYGLRWDTDFSPSSSAGPSLPAVTGFKDLSDLSQLALAPAGTPAYKNTFGNFAPRFGAAYRLFQRQDWGTVARGGFGVFYDLASSEAGNIILQTGYPFSGRAVPVRGGTFPLSPAAAAPAPIVPPTATNGRTLAAFAPNLQLPYTLEWNVALEQGLGSQQSLSVTYVGAAGRRLIQTAQLTNTNANLGRLLLVTNGATSDYNALQLQLQRRLVKSLQLLSSYTWAHSIDTASGGSTGVGSNSPAAGGGSDVNRGSSDFDVRHVFSAGVTYEVPTLNSTIVLKEVSRGWSLQSIVQAQSARPVQVVDGLFSQLTNGFTPDIRPDVMPGIPLYLFGPQYPGGRAINNTPGAVAGGCADGSVSVGPFCPPPLDGNGNPIRQGNVGRNSLKGFGLFQWDLAAHRDFPIRERVTLQFRAEMFNVLNHPNFAPPVADTLAGPQFGIANQMLGQYLAGRFPGAGGFNSLYQTGGPRSMQFALKLRF